MTINKRKANHITFAELMSKVPDAAPLDFGIYGTLKHRIEKRNNFIKSRLKKALKDV
jgi:sRNA-binding protein